MGVGVHDPWPRPGHTPEHFDPSLDLIVRDQGTSHRLGLNVAACVLKLGLLLCCAESCLGGILNGTEHGTSAAGRPEYRRKK